MEIDEPTKQAILTASQSWLALVDIGDFPEGLNRATENFRSRHSPELFEAKSLMWNSTKSSGGSFTRDFKSMRHTSSQFDWPQGDYIVVEYETRQTGLDKRPYLKSTTHRLRSTQSLGAALIVALVLVSGCAFLNKRPPYPDPDQLVSVTKVAAAAEEPLSGADFLTLRNESKTLEPIAAYVFKGLVLNEGEPERIHSPQVTADFFPTLGVRPVLGRALLPDDDKPDSNSVVVISYTLWQRRFGGDPNLIGRKMTLDGKPRTVVGIMPPDFRFPKDCDAWTPLASDFHDVSLNLRGKSMGIEVEVFARLKPGVTLQQAQAEMNLIAPKFERAYPEKNTARELKLTALRESHKQIDNVLEIKISHPAKPPVETGKEK